jgi:hypothetical protein
MLGRKEMMRADNLALEQRPDRLDAIGVQDVMTDGPFDCLQGGRSG